MFQSQRSSSPPAGALKDGAELNPPPELPPNCNPAIIISQSAACQHVQIYCHKTNNKLQPQPEKEHVIHGDQNFMLPLSEYFNKEAGSRGLTRRNGSLRYLPRNRRSASAPGSTTILENDSDLLFPASKTICTELPVGQTKSRTFSRS